jgi:hypothetical protein
MEEDGSMLLPIFNQVLGAAIGLLTLLVPLIILL